MSAQNWSSPNKAGGMLCHGMGCKLAEPAENNKAISTKVLQECAPGEEKGREDWWTWMGTGCLKTCLV